MFFLINNKITIPPHSNVETPTTNVHITTKMNIHLLIKQKTESKMENFSQFDIQSTMDRGGEFSPQQTYKQPHTYALVFDPSTENSLLFFIPFHCNVLRYTQHSSFSCIPYGVSDCWIDRNTCHGVNFFGV